jgi:hypothetical protein
MTWLGEIAQSTRWWDLVPAVVGAVLGAGAAAIPASWLARKASQEMLARDRVSRNEQQKAATLRVLVKLLTIVNGIETLHRGLEGMISQADADGHSDLALWQKVVPTVGFTSREIRFDAKELILFVSAKEFEYLNDLLLLAERYAALEAGFREYADRRGRLTDQLSAVMTGNVGTTYLTDEQKTKFEPRAVELTVLITQLREFLARDYPKALSVAERYGPKVRAFLNDPSFPILAIPKDVKIGS